MANQSKHKLEEYVSAVRLNGGIYSTMPAVLGDTLSVTGVLTATGGIQAASGALQPVVLAAAQQSLVAGGGAVSITTFYTAGASDAGGDAWTLANGTYLGQLKKIQLITDGGGDAVLTPTSLSGGTTITFADAGDFALLIWNGTAWVAIELGNDADGATAPALA